MSTLELHEYINQKGIINFSDGKKECGIIVAKYNIVQAVIEYFLICSSNIEKYIAAMDKGENNLMEKYWSTIDVSQIVNIELLN